MLRVRTRSRSGRSRSARAAAVAGAAQGGRVPARRAADGRFEAIDAGLRNIVGDLPGRMPAILLVATTTRPTSPATSAPTTRRPRSAPSSSSRAPCATTGGHATAPSASCSRTARGAAAVRRQGLLRQGAAGQPRVRGGAQGRDQAGRRPRLHRQSQAAAAARPIRQRGTVGTPAGGREAGRRRTRVSGRNAGRRARRPHAVSCVPGSRRST